MDDRQFSMLLDYYSFSWAGYRKVRKGVKKRIARHMDELGCRDMAAYIKKLESDSLLKSVCERLLTVPISRFFRDRRLWEILREKILPRFFDRQSVRVWSAGCAGGEEVYSLKIVWEQLAEKHPDLPALRVTACDLNSENLERAKKGVYFISSLKEVEEGIRDRFFEKGPTRKSWAVKSNLKKGIAWDRFNLLHDPAPAKAYDIIFLRNNILTYASEQKRISGFNNVVTALADSGILIIGAKERLPEGVLGFDSMEPAYIFKQTGKR